MSALENCPICGTQSTRRINESLRHCTSCSVAYNASYRPLSYDDRYFLDEYKRQYGKTYEQDFSVIYTVSKRRVKKILQHFPERERQSLRLLDIGSAMGFFLKAASDMGFGEVQGMEISRYASEYCIKNFKFSVIQKAYSPVEIPGLYDIITAWFFIEHSPDPLQVIRELYDKLKSPGMLAISVPSIFGPQFLLNREIWAETHPADHRIDFSPGALKKLLKDIGFHSVYFKPGGYHPDRVVSPSAFYFPLFSFFYTWFTRLFYFSDTLEVYALKK